MDCTLVSPFSSFFLYIQLKVFILFFPLSCYFLSMTAPAKFTPLIPRTYTPPAPPTGKKCEEPNPDEQYARLRAILQETTAEGNGNQEQGGGYLSYLTQIKDVAAKGIRNAQKGFDRVVTETEAHLRELQISLSEKVYQVTFPSLANSGEKFIASFPCSTVHDNYKVNGTLIITKNYLCFCSSSSAVVMNSAKDKMFGAAEQPTAPVIACSIPLSSVVSIFPSLALQTKGPTPYFTDIPDVPGILFTALQVFDDKNQLFQFFNFDTLGSKMEGMIYNKIEGTSIEFAYNYLDHAWREIVMV